MRSIKRLLVCASVFLLAACGGGGGGGGASDGNSGALVLDLRAGWKAYGQQSGQVKYTISGTVDGVQVGGVGTYFFGHDASTSLQTIDTRNPLLGTSLTLTNLSRTLFQFTSDITSASGTSRFNIIENWYYDIAGNLKVIWDVEEREYTMMTSSSLFPNQVTSGSSGQFFAGTIYSRLGYTCGTRNGSYEVTSKSSTTLSVTLIDKYSTTQQRTDQCSTSAAETRYYFELGGGGLLLKSITATNTTGTQTITFTF